MNTILKIFLPVLILLTGCNKQSLPKHPNLIYILTDEQVYCAAPGGIKELETPNLDKLASEGMVFTNCISNNPVCVPYRAMWLTGLHGHQNGFINNHSAYPLSPELATWSKILKSNGYTMGYIGKWHLTPGGENPRFEGAGKDRIVKKPAAQTPPEYRHGFDDLWIQSSNHGEVRATYYWDTDSVYKMYDGYAPTKKMDQLIGFIETYKNRKSPFCAVLSLLPPHPPYGGAPEKWVEFYKNIETPFWENVPEEHRTDDNMKKLKNYYSQVSAIDEEVGRLMVKLDEWGITDNTIVIFTSDHGDLHFAHGEKWKRWPWDESVKVPFIIRYPWKIKAGSKTEALLGAIDLAPTLLGLTGFSDQIPQSWQGGNLSHVMFGEEGPEPSSQLIMFNLPPPDHYILAKQPNLADYRGVRTKKYTYTLVKDPATGSVTPWLLYNNEDDPFQLKNLVGEEGMEKIKEQLYDEIRGHLEIVGEADWLKNKPKDFLRYVTR